MQRVDPRTVSLAGISTALVAAATIAFRVDIAATKGYFNVGEIMIYTVAILLGPKIGAFAGGVGASIVDVATGFAFFAPGTLAIKAAEGFIVGYLAQKRWATASTLRWRGFSSIVALATALLIGFIGVTYYAGSATATWGLLPLWASSFEILIPAVFWVGVAAVVGITIGLAGMTVDPAIGWTVFCVVLGGAEMVMGYFLYETAFIGLGAALGELPFNVGQLTVGLIVSLPLAKAIMQRMQPRFKENRTRI